MNRLVNCFIIGCQKTGSSWLFECFREHPDIFIPKLDAIHYFTINHIFGEQYLTKFYDAVGSEKIICDPTPSYIRSPDAASRIYQYNPNSKLIFTLRNPIERSFSHYWHHKRKGQINFNFTDTLEYRSVGNYDLYEIWIKSSLYFQQIKPFLDIFPRDQIKINVFDDLLTDPRKYIKSIYAFLEVDPLFVPSVIETKVNAALKSKTETSHRSLFEKLAYYGLRRSILQLFNRGNKTKLEKQENEYVRGIDQDFRDKLRIIFREDVVKLSDLLERDLTHWLE